MHYSLKKIRVPQNTSIMYGNKPWNCLLELSSLGRNIVDIKFSAIYSSKHL